MCYKNNSSTNHKPHVVEMYFFLAVVVIIDNRLYVCIALGIQLYFFSLMFW